MLPAKIPATSKSATQQPQLNRDDQSQIPSPNAGAFSNTNPRNGPFIVVVHGAEDTITRPPSQFILPDKENLPTLKLKDEPPDGGHATQPPDTFRAPVNPSFGRDRTMLKMKKKSRLKNAPSHTTYRKRVTNRVLHQSRSSTFESTHQASDSVCKDFLDMFSILQVLKNGELIKLVDTTPEYQNLFGSVANLLRVLLDKWGAAKHMTELQWQLMKDFINKYIRETAKKTCFDDLRNVAPQLSVPVESLPIIEIEEDEEEEEQDPSQLGETPALAYNQFAVVEFLHTKDVEVIPKTWVTEDNHAFWPPFKNNTEISNAIKTVQDPPSTWEKFKIRILHDEEEDFEKSKNKLNLGETTSPLATCEDENSEKQQLEEKEETKNGVPLENSGLPKTDDLPNINESLDVEPDELPEDIENTADKTKPVENTPSLSSSEGFHLKKRELRARKRPSELPGNEKQREIKRLKISKPLDAEKTENLDNAKNKVKPTDNTPSLVTPVREKLSTRQRKRPKRFIVEWAGDEQATKEPGSPMNQLAIDLPSASANSTSKAKSSKDSPEAESTQLALALPEMKKSVSENDFEMATPSTSLSVTTRVRPLSSESFSEQDSNRNYTSGLLKRVINMLETNSKQVKHNTTLLNKVLFNGIESATNGSSASKNSSKNASSSDKKSVLKRGNRRGSAIVKRNEEPTPTIAELNLPSFPLTNFHNLECMEKRFEEDSTLQLRLARCLSNCGGTNVENITRKILRTIIAQDMSLRISWAGTSEKSPFKDLHLRNIVVSAVRSQMPDVTDFQVEGVIKSWFRFAADRNGGRQRRKELKMEQFWQSIP